MKTEQKKTAGSRTKADLIQEFCEILNKNLPEKEDAASLISAWQDSCEYLFELSTWHKSFIGAISDMRNLICQSRNNELIGKFKTIEQTFIEGMLLGREHQHGIRLQYNMTEQINNLLEETYE